MSNQNKNKANNKSTGRSKNFKSKSNRSKGNNRNSGQRSLLTTNAEDQYYRSEADRRSNNDPSFYNWNPNMLEAAGKQTFAFSTGQKFYQSPDNVAAVLYNGYDLAYRLDKTSSLTGVNSGYYAIEQGANPITTPGIMRLSVHLVPGYSDNADSPLNEAAQNLYHAIRSQQTSALPFDANDLMLYILAIDNIIIYYQKLLRAYKIHRSYDVENLYSPEALLVAMGISPEDMAAHSDNLWSYLLDLSMTLKTFPIPTKYKLFERHSTILSNVYKDSESERAQMYFFDVDGVYKFNETATSAPVGQLTYTMLPGRSSNGTSGKLATIAELITFGKELVRPLRFSGDAKNIIAAIRRIYNQGSFYEFPDPSQTEMLYPTFNYEILNQIHNAKFTGNMAFTSPDEIVQDEDKYFLIYQPNLPTSNYRGNCVIVDTALRAPDSMQVMEMTRFSTLVAGADKVTFGAEFIKYASFYSLLYGTFGSDTTVNSVGIGVIDNVDFTLDLNVDASALQSQQAKIVDAFGVISTLSAFDQHPEFRVIGSINASNNNTAVLGRYWDVDNMATIDFDKLRLLNRTALLSLFSVPLTGTDF